MNAPFTILIADRNSHVRMFLMRELMAEGYRVKLAATGANVLTMVYAREGTDLLILDPDLPGCERDTMLEILGERIPALPVVLHTHRRKEEERFPEDAHWLTIIEKTGDSVERIKEAVVQMLKSSSDTTAAASETEG